MTYRFPNFSVEPGAFRSADSGGSVPVGSECRQRISQRKASWMNWPAKVGKGSHPIPNGKPQRNHAVPSCPGTRGAELQLGKTSSQRDGAGELPSTAVSEPILRKWRKSPWTKKPARSKCIESTCPWIAAPWSTRIRSRPRLKGAVTIGTSTALMEEVEFADGGVASGKFR